MKKNKIFSFLLILALLFSFYSVSFAEENSVYTQNKDNELAVWFIGMDTTNGEKSGDCALIRTPDGFTMLIDAGEPTAGKTVVEQLKKIGIKKIDMLVASHPHIDHVGGMPQVMDNFKIGAVYTSTIKYDTATNMLFLNTLKAHDLEHVILSKGDSLTLGAHVQIDILSPTLDVEYPADYPKASTQFVNNHSLVMKIMYGTSSFLFAGDLYVKGEKDVVSANAEGALKADVLKVNHHGDTTSSSLTFRKAVDPKIAVMTCNSIQNLALCQKFQKKGIDLYHTFVDGTVKISTTGANDYVIQLQNPRKPDFKF